MKIYIGTKEVAMFAKGSIEQINLRHWKKIPQAEEKKEI